jgi:threonine/homoserine/homoserine lactone efflux protein
VLESYLTGVGINLLNPKVVLFFMTFLPQFVDRHDPFAPRKLVFLGLEFIAVSIPLAVATVLLAGALAELLTRNRAVQRALNWTFAAVFAGFAATILFAEVKR